MKHCCYEKDGSRKYYHIDEDEKIVNEGYYYLRGTCYENMTEKAHEEMNRAISDGEYQLNNIGDSPRPLSPYERNRNAVYATGNRWAIENWNATH